MYLVIYNSEDGVSVTSMTREQLLDRITPDEDGSTYYGSMKIVTTLPEHIDAMTPDDVLYVVKTAPVKLSQEQVVTKYKIEE